MIIIVKQCLDCPFFASKDEKLGICSVSTPRHRLVAKDADRPSFCLLRREQVIVRLFS